MAFAVFKPLYKIRYFVIGFVSIGSVFGLINRASYGSGNNAPITKQATKIFLVTIFCRVCSSCLQLQEPPPRPR